MPLSFFFYDLETTGFNPRFARIMQFAGQRTDMDLNPVGDPVNELVKITDDILPDPEAILITGITPQATKVDGLSEAEFLKLFWKEVTKPGTIFMGFNSVRFDDEFMRYLQYRNFYDPYEWQWKDDRSRWDLLDVVRMTRALRPDGIKWPVDSDGKPANRLTLLTSINKLEHSNAHDALSDVQATIDLARLLKTKQPKLFNYLLEMRDKKKVAELVNSGQPFVYSSGKYSSEFEKTTVVTKLCDHPKDQGALVYDLRFSPSDFVGLQPEEIVEYWTRKWDDPKPRLPVKVLKYNRCPAVAPMGVLDKSAQERLQLDLKQIDVHRQALRDHPEFIANLLKALKILDKKQQASLLENEQLVDTKLYDGFFGDADKPIMQKVRTAQPNELPDLAAKFKDKRLQALVPLYKARNYPKTLTDEERKVWEAYRQQRLLGKGAENRVNRYFARIEELATTKLTQNQRYLLEELKLYGESLLPDTDN